MYVLKYKMTIKNLVEVKRISSDLIRPLRHAELRQGQDFTTTFYDKDYEEDTIHMACLRQNKVISCATFYPEVTHKLKSENPYRLRGMATATDFTRRGIGTLLMKKTFKLLQKKDVDIIWCNARLGAFNFYKKLGFEVIGDIFNIKDIGPHYYMFKKI